MEYYFSHKTNKTIKKIIKKFWVIYDPRSAYCSLQLLKTLVFNFSHIVLSIIANTRIEYLG